MCVVWDKCTINITNNTGQAMTFTTAQVSAGTWDSSPPSTIDSGATASFAGRSTCGNASDGCGGSITYTLFDGTTAVLNYVLSYYYGIADNSQYTPGFGGARPQSWQYLVNSHTTDSSNGGAGKRATWNLTIASK
jgi:hypothetical protein